MIKVKSITQAILVFIHSFLLLLAFSVSISAQTDPSVAQSQASPTPGPNANLEKDFFKNILSDQRLIWTAPFHMQASDAKWTIPLTGAFAALLASDRHTSGELVENGDDQDRLNASHYISELGAAYTTGTVAASFYLFGRATHNAHARETGVLSGEALINGAIVATILKAATQRQRPPTDNSSGEFWDGGSSFPSGHAISAWSVFTVIAKEYGQHRPVLRLGLYGMATAVSVSRFTGRNHFLSDVLIGSAIGYGIGRCTYERRHDPALESEPKSKTSKVLHSKFFPTIAPEYNRPGHSYGAMLSWDLGKG